MRDVTMAFQYLCGLRVCTLGRREVYIIWGAEEEGEIKGEEGGGNGE